MMDYKELQNELFSLKGVDVQEIGNIHSGNIQYRVYQVCTGQKENLRILLSAGIHGDEPAGVSALIEFMKYHIKDYADKLNFSIFPCLNPWGFEHNRRTNYYGIDINRSFVKNNSIIALILKKRIASGPDYALALNLHEDNTNIEVEGFPKEENPKSFYLYENSLETKGFGIKVIQGLIRQGIEICTSDTIYGEANKQGVIFSIDSKGEFEESLRKYAKKIIVTETPTCWSLEKRISVQLNSLLTALEILTVE